MFKKLALAAIPALLFVSQAMADDDLASIVSKFDGSNGTIQTVANDVKNAKEEELGQSDVDSLMGDKKVDENDAVAACFRRHGGGYGSYGSYSCYGSSYFNSCWYPSYTSSYSSCWTPSYYCCTPSYTTSYCYTPTYTTSYCCTPTYTSCWSPSFSSSWGCW